MRRKKVGELLDELAGIARSQGRNTCNLLADVVNIAQCGLWVGKRRTSEDPSTVEMHLNQLAFYGEPREERDQRRGKQWIAYRHRSDSPLQPVDVMDAELEVAEVKRGLEQVGINLPAGWRGLTPATRSAGGRKHKYDQLIQTLFDRAAQQLENAKESITQKALLRKIESWSRREHRCELNALGVRALGAAVNTITVVDARGISHERKDVRRYTKRAKKAVGIA